MSNYDKLPVILKNYIDSNNTKILLDGYLKILSKEEQEKYSVVAMRWQEWRPDNIIFAVTAFGDILSWEEDGESDYVMINRIIDGRVNVLLSEVEFFFDDISDAEFQNEKFDIPLYKQAKDKMGSLADDECYIFEPIPSLGGDKDVSHISKGKIFEYLNYVIEMS